MSNLIQLGSSFADVELLKNRKKTEIKELSGELKISHFEERAISRHLVIEELPARVLVAGDWMSIELIDMSEKGFSFEVDRIMGGRFEEGQRLVFALRVPELREFSLVGRIQWKRFEDETGQVRCGVEIIEIHGPGGGISVAALMKLIPASARGSRRIERHSGTKRAA